MIKTLYFLNLNNLMLQIYKQVKALVLGYGVSIQSQLFFYLILLFILFIVSRSIVERHNGTIGYIEKEGGGAIFYFELEIFELPFPPHVTSSDSQRPDDLTLDTNSNSPIIPIDDLCIPPPIKHSRALVVDDSSMNRKLLGRLLVPYFDVIDEVTIFFNLSTFYSLPGNMMKCMTLIRQKMVKLLLNASKIP